MSAAFGKIFKKCNAFLLAFLCLFTVACTGGGKLTAKAFMPDGFYDAGLTPFVIDDVSQYFDGADGQTKYSANLGSVVDKKYTLSLINAGSYAVELTATRGKAKATLNFVINAVYPVAVDSAFKLPVLYEGQTYQYALSDIFSNIAGVSYAPEVTFTASVGTISDGKWHVAPVCGVQTVTITAKRADREVDAVFSMRTEPAELFGGLNNTAKVYAGRAMELNTLVREKYFLEDAQFGFHYYPNIGSENGDNSTAFLWPYTEMVASTWRLMSIDGRSPALEAHYRNLLYGFEYYRALRSDYHTYTAVRATQVGWGGGDTYYDDNVWLAREFLNAYEVLGDTAYLETCINVCEWIWTGWANDEIGGLYWCEQQKESRNACSNAPASILFARVSEYVRQLGLDGTTSAEWLNRAKKTYDFVFNRLRRESDGLIYDSIANNGTVNTNEGWIFTYNCGSFITAGMKLHEITGEGKYLTDAKFTAAGSYDWFFKDSARGYKTITSANPWFNVLLLDGFIELYKEYPDALTYITAYESNLNYAYENFRSPEGFMHSNWVSGGGFDRLNVLDMAANAENFGQLAHFYESVKQ